MGYDIYVPEVVYNYLSFNKKDCPIWIKVNDDGDCYVFLQQRDNNMHEEVVNFITNYLPKKKALHCCRFSTSLRNKADIRSIDKYELDCACVDEDSNLHAYITIGDGVVGKEKVLMIKDLWYDDEIALIMLREYLLREENITKHRSKVICHSKTKKEVIDILHFVDMGDGLYLWQFE